MLTLLVSEACAKALNITQEADNVGEGEDARGDGDGYGDEHMARGPITPSHGDGYGAGGGALTRGNGNGNGSSDSYAGDDPEFTPTLSTSPWPSERRRARIDEALLLLEDL